MLYPIAIYPLFLAGVIAAFWAVSPAARRHVLWISSTALIIFLSWRSALAFLALTVVTYQIGRRLARKPSSPNTTRALMTIGIAVPLLYLATFKYLPEYAPPIRSLLQVMSAELLLPLGISYFTFKFIHYIIEARRGTLPAHDWWDFLTYSSLFSIFAAGPIERFHTLQPQLGTPVFDATGFAYGIQRIVEGSIKKVLIADFFLVALLEHVAVAHESPANASLVAQALFLWASFLHVYFDFSGYSDIAIGTSRLFGLTVMENFDWPILRRNISEFWRAWHISLSNWCRDYVYFPVFGATRNPKLSIYASMLAIGYWHSPNPTWICWGLWHASGLAIWQMWQVFKRKRPALQRASRNSLPYRIAATVVTINFVVLGAVWHATGSVGRALEFLYYLVS